MRSFHLIIAPLFLCAVAAFAEPSDKAVECAQIIERACQDVPVEERQREKCARRQIARMDADCKSAMEEDIQVQLPANEFDYDPDAPWEPYLYLPPPG
jgi:hypothetical protein